MNWRFFVRMALPMVRMAGEEFKNKDSDSVGKDDLLGISLTYAADLIEAAINGTAPPKAPESLQ